MYDDLPESVKRSNPPGGGRDLEEKMEAARQVDIRQRLQREKRERVNYYLDLAVRERHKWEEGVGAVVGFLPKSNL